MGRKHAQYTKPESIGLGNLLIGAQLLEMILHIGEGLRTPIICRLITTYAICQTVESRVFKGSAIYETSLLRDCLPAHAFTQRGDCLAKICYLPRIRNAWLGNGLPSLDIPVQRHIDKRERVAGENLPLEGESILVYLSLRERIVYVKLTLCYMTPGADNRLAIQETMCHLLPIKGPVRKTIGPGIWHRDTISCENDAVFPNCLFGTAFYKCSHEKLEVSRGHHIISVDKCHEFALSMFNCSISRTGDTAIFKINDANILAQLICGEFLPRPIRGTIINADYFIIVIALRQKRIETMVNTVFKIMEKDEDRYKRPRTHLKLTHPPSPSLCQRFDRNCSSS